MEGTSQLQQYFHDHQKCHCCIAIYPGQCCDDVWKLIRYNKWNVVNYTKARNIQFYIYRQIIINYLIIAVLVEHRRFFLFLPWRNEHPSSYSTADDGRSEGMNMEDNVAIAFNSNDLDSVG